MTAEEFSGVLSAYTALWPQAQLPERDGLGIWRRLWESVPLEDLLTAITALAEEGDRFAPPPGAVLARARELRCDDATLADAWAEVRQRMADEGWQACDHSTAWSDALIGQAVDSLGAEWIGVSDDAPLSVKAAQFREAFRALAERRRQDRQLAALPSELPRVVAARQRTGEFVRIGETREGER